MIQITDPRQCCGCTACASACSHNAITMKPDTLGFMYPVVDEDKCVSCGLCEKVCAFNIDYDKSLNISHPKTFALRHSDIGEVMNSQSGGAFVVLSDYILNLGGIIYGATFAENDFRSIIHERAETKKERDRFRGSKYTQSNLNDVFSTVKKDLITGKLVLFSGTPCQTAGLNSFVGKKLREKLILVDIVCHGVPSPAIWANYLDNLETKYGKIEDACFRNKKAFGWKSHRESFVFSGKREYSSDSYTYLFYRHIMMRHSCSACPFTNVNARPSDITIGDCWGAQKFNLFNNDDKGISLVIINTDKGAKLFDHICDVCNIIPINIANFLQPNLQHPTIPHPKRMNFEKDYAKRGFKYVLRKYGNQSLRYRIKSFIPKSLLDKIIKNIR